MWRVLLPVFRSLMSHKHNEWDDYEASQSDMPVSAVIVGTEPDSWPLLYRIQVTSPKGTFEITRRYNQFVHLKHHLKVDLRFLTFPPGRVYITTWGLIYRKRQLNHLLAYLCARNLSVADRETFYCFLQLSSAAPASPPSSPLPKEQAVGAAADGEGKGEHYCDALGCWQCGPCSVHHGGEEVEEKKADALQEASEKKAEELEEKRLEDDQEPAPEGGEFEIVESFEAPTEPNGPSMFPQFESAPPGMRVVQNIPYIAGSEEDYHRLDIYVPTPPEATPQSTWPVVVHVHGGGWVRGGRKIGFYGAPSMCRAYAQRGFLAVAVSYRLGKAPNHTHDAIAAIKWVQENIAQYGGQPNNLFLSGHSAGGNIVTLMGLSSELGLPPSNFKGIIAVSGVYNIDGPMNKSWKNKVFKSRYINSTFGKDPNVIVRNSPISLIRILSGFHPLDRFPWREDKANTFQIQGAVKSDVPFFVLSAADDLGLEKDAVDFVVHLKLNGFTVQYDSVAESNHPNICWSEITHNKAAAFLRSVLARKQ